MKLTRRHVLPALMGVATLAAMRDLRAAQSRANCGRTLSGRRINLVVPFAAGGGYDQYARALAPVLEAQTGARTSVSNIPAGSGVVAAKTVADGDESHIRLGIFEASLIIDVLGSKGVDSTDFIPLASMSSEVQAWTSRPGFSLLERRGAPLVAAVSDVVGNVIELGLAAHALGTPLRFIPGYRGSADRFSAVLRGEVDITANSATSTLKAIRGGDLAAALVVSDAPDPQMPGVPHLAGPQGLVARIHADKPGAERAEAMRIAQVAVDVSTSLRSVFVSSKLSDDMLACLQHAVEAAVGSAEFARAAGAVGRPVKAADRRSTQAAMDRMREGVDRNRALLKKLVATATQ